MTTFCALIQVLEWLQHLIMDRKQSHAKETNMHNNFMGLKHPTINAERKHSKLAMCFHQIHLFPTPLPGDDQNTY